MQRILNKIYQYKYNHSKEGLKLKKPTYDMLMEYNNKDYKADSRKIISFGAGRSGQNWLSKIFNAHDSWIGTNERFNDYEAFYRYIMHYNLPIDKESIYKLLELSVKYDQYKYGNSFVASPYFSFGMKELCDRLNPTDIFYNIREPISTIESFYLKGFYDSKYILSNDKLPTIDIKTGVYRGMSRIIPNDNFLEEWLTLTRIGKITWFWAYSNKILHESFQNMSLQSKYLLKLEDISNYNFYDFLDNKYNFEDKLTKKQFNNIVNNTPNKSTGKKYKYKDWTELEKKEYEYVIDKFFSSYDDIRKYSEI
jgi:hypothetical protein